MSSISSEEIEREVRTLKNLRRRSSSAPGPGALPVDPDLPPRDSFSDASAPSPYSSNDDVTLSLSTPDGLDGDAGLFWVPAHLHPELAPGEFRAFLKQHTQVDPAAVEAGEPGEASLSRNPSWVARSNSMTGGLGRKKSMLSRQYTPHAGDKIEDESPPMPARRSGSLYGGRNGDTGLTLQDLQKLEELVDDSDLGDDPEKMRHMLRRSLSLNKRPGVLDEGLQGDEENAPIVVPRPGSIIRRTARTKIRKGGPEAGRRFSSTRRTGTGRLTSPSTATVDSSLEDGDSRMSEERRSDDWRSDERRSEDRRSDERQSDERRSDERRSDERRSDEARSDERRSDERRSDEASDEMADKRGNEYADAVRSTHDYAEEEPDDDMTEEALIFDAYARDRSSTSTTSSVSSLYDEASRSPSPDARPSLTVITPASAPKLTDKWFEDEELTPTQESPMGEALKNRVSPHAGDSSVYAPPSTSSLASPQHARPAEQQYELPPGMAPPRTSSAASNMYQQQQQAQRTTPAPAPVVERPPLARTDSGASTVTPISPVVSPGVSPSSSAAPVEKEKHKEKEKKTGLFGKSKKDKDKDKETKHKKEKERFLGSLFGSKKKQEEPSSVSNFATAGPAAAAALLGTSKSAKSLQHGSGTSSPTSPGFSNFARYPIHVERAVYRLSHIKLANARRPLIEQVLISNLMFWYLGVIGRTTGPAEEKKPGSTNGLDKERDEAQRNPPPKGTPSKPADSGSAGVKQPDPPTPTRKTGLTKPERSRTPNANAEAAYRAPQYGMQNAQMDKDMRSHPQHGQHPQQHPQQQHSQQQPPQSPQQHPQHPQQPQHKPQQQPQQHPQHQHPQQHTAPPSPQPRTSSMQAPNRTRSPPSPGNQVRPEYPPGVAPPRAFTPPMPGQRSPVAVDPRQRTISHPPGAQPSHPQHQGGPPNQRPPQGYQQNGGPRQAEPPRGGPYSPQHAGAQPGQIFQYPGMAGGPGQFARPPPGGGLQPGQVFAKPQPGQIFHHPQFGQRPPPQQQPNNWEAPQRLPPGQQPPRGAGPALAQAPPRTSSANSLQDPYGRPGPNAYRQGQTSPTQQSFYASQGRPQSPGQQYQYQTPPGAQPPRPQPVSPGYPHHR